MSPRRSPELEARFRRLHAEQQGVVAPNATTGRLSLSLPWPPQANHYYAVVRGRKILGSAGRRYHKDVLYRIPPGQRPLMGRLRVLFRAFPPDRRKRDLSNLLKAAEDALTKAGAWGDDSQIDDLRIVRMPVQEGGALRVEIEEIPS